MNRMFKDFLRGLWDENPIFRLLIGMCPTLAVTTSAVNGMSMGIATAAVLICSSALISLVKKLIPDKVRIPAYIVIIATLVTVVDMSMNAYTPDLHRALGLFLPLIAVNCIVLGRAEAYASKMPVLWSIFDAAGMGLGFTWALTLLGSVRELLGTGSVFGLTVFGDGYVPWKIMTLPPGGFLTLGILLGILNVITAKLRKAA